MTCIVCAEVEKYPHGENVHYICGVCVQTLLNTSPEEISKSFIEAEKEGDKEYQWAMRCFMYQNKNKVKVIRKI